jgi:hypothetical protein
MDYLSIWAEAGSKYILLDMVLCLFYSYFGGVRKHIKI